jgi:DNA primase
LEDLEEEIILAFDGDNAGRQGILDALERLKNPSVKVLVLPKEFKDVGDIKDEEDFKEVLDRYCYSRLYYFLSVELNKEE